MGQHVSGLSVRHPFASVQLLVRTQRGVDADLSAPTRDSRVPARLRGAFRRARAHPLPVPDRARRMGRAGRRVAARDPGRAVLGAVPDRGARAAQRALDPLAPRDGRLPGRRLPHRPLESRPRPDRPQRRGHRHGRVGDPDRPHDPAGGQAHHDLPAHRAVGGPPPGPSDHRVRAAPVPPRSGGAASRADLGVRRPRTARHRTRLPAGADEHRAEDGGGAPGQAGPRRGAPRQADAGLRDRVQAHPPLEQVVSGDHASPTSTS